MGIWKEIRKEGSLLSNNIVFSVGNGRRVRFWKDKWCGDEALCVSFSSLYGLAVSKVVWVAEVWDSLVGWGEVGILVSLGLSTIRRWTWWSGPSWQFKGSGEDRVLWKKTEDEIFSVKTLYGALEPGNTVLFPWRIIWCPCVPSKVGFFAWESSWGKVLMLDQLKRRGWSLENRCFLCLAIEVSINHILIHCTKTRVLFVLVWHGSFVGKKCKKVCILAYFPSILG